MNQKDYIQSMQYIEKFYQNKAGENKETPEESNGSHFDDLPKSVTEESSMFDNDQRNKNRSSIPQKQIQYEDGGHAEFAFNNFDTSERFDDSMTSEKFGRKTGGQHPPVDMLGVSIDSQSINQSMLNASMSSTKQKIRKHQKQKEDLDGSRVYRNRDQVEDSPQRQSLKQKKKYQKEEMKGGHSNSPQQVLKKKKSNSPLKNNFLKENKPKLMDKKNN